MISRRSIATTAVAGALAVGVLVPTAFAQDAEDDATDTEQPETTREDRHAEEQAAFAEALADELGLDAETVAAAVAEVRAAQEEARAAEHQARVQARLDEAVEAGELTQEQADALLAAQEAGVLGRRGHRGFGGPGFGGRGGRRGPGGMPPSGADDDASAEGTAFSIPFAGSATVDA